MFKCLVLKVEHNFIAALDFATPINGGAFIYIFPVTSMQFFPSTFFTPHPQNPLPHQVIEITFLSNQDRISCFK
jgi:hypothetical protein